jgi:hypothetical protein
MPDLFWLTKLHPGADLAAYETFVRRRDYPRVAAFPSVRRYRVHRIKGTLNGEAPPAFDFVEHFDVTDVAAYQADRAAAPGREAFRRELYSYLRIALPLDTEAIE